MSYGMHHALRDVIKDLRDYRPLLQALTDKEIIAYGDSYGRYYGGTDTSDIKRQITEGWPRDEQSEPIVVRVQPITETSGHRGMAVSRQFRLQFSVVATQEWRDDQLAPTYEQARIMSLVADRMDGGLSIDDVLPGETASGSWQEVTGDRLALIQDWQVESVSEL